MVELDWIIAGQGDDVTKDASVASRWQSQSEEKQLLRVYAYYMETDIPHRVSSGTD